MSTFLMKSIVGITLKVTPYLESKSIIHLFSRQYGILSIFARAPEKRNIYRNAIASPLMRGKFFIRHKNYSACSLYDAHLIDAYLEIRANLHKLRAAFQILHALEKTQIIEHPAPQLYISTEIYLRKLKTFPDPKVLASSFQMKLLYHEGLLPKLQREYRSLITHFTDSEWNFLHQLRAARSFQDLRTLTISELLYHKVNQFFQAIAKEGS